METLLIFLAIYLPLLAATWISIVWGPASLPNWGARWLWPASMTKAGKAEADRLAIALADADAEIRFAYETR